MLYIIIGIYYLHHNNDIPAAINSFQSALSLATLVGNSKRESEALYNLAWTNWQCGDYYAGQMRANQSQRVAKISGHLFREANGLQVEIMCCSELGDYKKSIPLCERAQDLLELCGMSGGDLHHAIMNSQAEVHRLKSEYVEASNIHARILDQTRVEEDPCNHALALLNIAEIDVLIGTPKDNVERNIGIAKALFDTMGELRLIAHCDAVRVDLLFREGDHVAANQSFQECLKLSWGKNNDVATYCLERLGDVSHWDTRHQMLMWPALFLSHALRSKKKREIYKALQFLGDMFLAKGDKETAISLFSVGLEGFTQMDIHKSRAECMLRLGDIADGDGDLLKAVEFWQNARPLFERSLQLKQLALVDERINAVPQGVVEEHRKNQVRVA
ncbi:hypothetical protein FB451DRAFT_600510 [Mycena latifolia]|nr:hypothetical protein FB451DRAFT_600510 [Mycena latifolia]